MEARVAALTLDPGASPTCTCRRYLLCIADHIQTCRFGTFLCNTNKVRPGLASVPRSKQDCCSYIISASQVACNWFPTSRSHRYPSGGCHVMKVSLTNCCTPLCSFGGKSSPLVASTLTYGPVPRILKGETLPTPPCIFAGCCFSLFCRARFCRVDNSSFTHLLKRFGGR